MQLDFWLDPACPFCWITSRWLVDVAPERDLQINWKPISLMVKNNVQSDSPYYAQVVFTHSLLRVIEAIREAGQADKIGDFYAAIGTKIHHDGETGFDVADVLDKVGLDPSIATAMDDEGFDAAIRASMDDGLSLTGQDVGTPIIAFTGSAGRVGLFGPVITKMPKGDDALKLFDGFVAMAETDGFFELKRTRTGGPDMSTITLS